MDGASYSDDTATSARLIANWRSVAGDRASRASDRDGSVKYPVAKAWGRGSLPGTESDVWTDRMRAKLGDDVDKRMRFLLQVLQLFYTLTIGKDATIHGTPFHQYLGPVRT